MKKLFTKSVACIIISVIMLSSVFGVVSFATENDPNDPGRYLNNTSTLYFSKLKNNFGNNFNNACAYVAVAMLLSYYDSYWCDDIIPDDRFFDAIGSFNSSTMTVTNSPGINRYYNSDNVDYNDLIDSFSNTYFLFELLRIGRDELWFGGRNSTNQANDPENSVDLTWALNLSQELNLIRYYLYEKVILDNDRQLTEDDVEVNCYTYLDVTNADLEAINSTDPNDVVRYRAINLIQQGVPVFFVGYPSDSSSSQNGSNGISQDDLGHTMIAYDYDAENDEIYFHTGWYHFELFNNFTILPEKNSTNIYKENLCIIWLDINESNFSHSCSNNYVDTINYTVQCMCVFSHHPCHNHTGDYTGYDSSRHSISCDWCGTVSQLHSYYYSMYSSTQHKVRCDCGYTYYQPHVVAIGPSKICLRCGCIIGSGGGLLQSVTEVIYLTESGSYMRPDGIVMLSEEDVALYLSGELDIDALINQSNTVMR